MFPSFVGSNFIFNEKVADKLRELIRFDESVKDVCDPNAPNDNAWWQYLREVNALIGEAINANKNNLSSLK